MKINISSFCDVIIFLMSIFLIEMFVKKVI